MEFVGRIGGVASRAVSFLTANPRMMATAVVVAAVALGGIAVVAAAEEQGSICVVTPQGYSPMEVIQKIQQWCFGELHQGQCPSGGAGMVDLLTCSRVAAYVRNHGFPTSGNSIRYLQQMIRSFELRADQAL